MNFDQAFTLLEGVEGGYSNRNPVDDPGGETNFGISKRSYPNEDIAGMTEARAKEIYLRDYWNLCSCDQLPQGINFDVFDCGVNSGVRRSIMLLQQAVYADVDGVIGPHTLLGITYMPVDKLRRRFNGLRLAFMQSLANWHANSGGWAVRISTNLLRE